MFKIFIPYKHFVHTVYIYAYMDVILLILRKSLSKSSDFSLNLILCHTILWDSKIKYALFSSIFSPSCVNASIINKMIFLGLRDHSIIHAWRKKIWEKNAYFIIFSSVHKFDRKIMREANKKQLREYQVLKYSTLLHIC